MVEEFWPALKKAVYDKKWEALKRRIKEKAQQIPLPTIPWLLNIVKEQLAVCA